VGSVQENKRKRSKYSYRHFDRKAQNIDKLLGLHVLKADDYITKPFGKNELIGKVKRLTGLTDKKQITTIN